MQRQRGELVPIGDALAGLDGPATAIRDDSPQARHHFTQRRSGEPTCFGQRRKDPDLGFMARMMALCSLPRTNTGDRIRYKRVNGPYTLYMTAGGGCKLPYGNLPRLLLAWLSTEAVRGDFEAPVLTAHRFEYVFRRGRMAQRTTASAAGLAPPLNPGRVAARS